MRCSDPINRSTQPSTTLSYPTRSGLAVRVSPVGTLGVRHRRDAYATLDAGSQPQRVHIKLARHTETGNLCRRSSKKKRRDMHLDARSASLPTPAGNTVDRISHCFSRPTIAWANSWVDAVPPRSPVRTLSSLSA